MWSERIIKICFFSGVAPVYKPGNLATGQVSIRCGIELCYHHPDPTGSGVIHHMVNGGSGLFRFEPVTVLPGWLGLRKSVLSYLG